MKSWLPRAGLAIALVAGIVRAASGQTFEVIHDFGPAFRPEPSAPIGHLHITAGCAGPPCRSPS